MVKKRIVLIWALMTLVGALLVGPVFAQQEDPPTADSAYPPLQPPASLPLEGRPASESILPVPPASPRNAPILRQQLSVPSLDPADQIEPPAIDLAPLDRPISPVMAIAMYQELEKLIGRFESAQLTALAQNQPTPVAATERLTAAVEPVPPAANPVLNQGRDLLNEWFDLIEGEDYAIAQERWEAVRQALWDRFPKHPYAQPEIRAVWLDRGTIVAAGNRQGLSQVFDRLAQAGFNTVFFETLNAGFPIYPSRLAVQNPLTVRWDPLQAAVELAHERNMELHAWVWTFAAGNQVHNRLLNLPPDFDGPMLSLHPDWVGYDNRGNTIPLGQTKPFYDPANQQLRTFLLRLFSEILAGYDVDGLQLDYIRYPFQNPGGNRTYGYGNDARWRFRALSGVDPTELSPRPDPSASRSVQQRQRDLWNRWTEFRTQQVNTFVLEVSQMVRRQRPDATLSVAVFAKPRHERLQKIQQDWETWAQEGYVDWVVLMSYAADTSRFEQLVTPWLVGRDFGRTLILPSIRLLDLPSHAALDQIQAARDLPTAGYAAFAATDLTADLETVLAQTQGNLGTGPLVQEDPYAVVLQRYRALQREWSWLLSQGYMWIAQDRRDRWITQVNALEDRLAALVEQPSARARAEVRSQLEQVQTSIDDRISVGVTSSAYRLQTWQHRLDILETLLAYGDRNERPER